MAFLNRRHKMKHSKKMLQYAQDAQVTDTPWKWWECASKGKDDWETLTSPSQWFACVKYRRKPEIDGKFKIGDRVTFAQKCKGVEGVIDANGVYTVKGFEHPRGDRYYVRLENGAQTLTVRDELLELTTPKFKVGDRVVFTSVDLIDPQHIGVSFEVVSEKGVWVSVRNPVTGFTCRTQVETLTLAPQRLEALSEAVGFDVPVPLQEAPAVGTAVYAPRPTLFPSYIQKTWKGHTGDLRELEMGFLHLHFKDAQIHAKALAAISSPHFCP
jgi:hypothetical protein